MMNKYKFVAAVAFAMVSGSALGAVDGSKHDMTGGLYNVGGTNTQICVFCHTPHKSVTGSGPLWNRNPSANTYTMYTSTTLGGAMSTTPGPESISCLSCHDGTIAVNTLINDPGQTNITETPLKITGYALIGAGTVGVTSLQSEHPIGVTYDPIADTGLNAIVNLDPQLQDNLFGTDKVECATCHDVHNGPVATLNAAMLRVSVEDSQICTDCHAK